MKKKFELIYLILAVLSFLYSIAVYMVGSGTFSFMIWVSAAVFFGFLFFMEKWQLWAKVPKALRYAFRAVVAAGLIIFIICQSCILSSFFSKGEPEADYIIVLGAQMRSWGPSVVYKARLDSAIVYLNNNPEAKVVVTGGQGGNEPVSEGEGGKVYLMEQGISEDRIIVENTSLDTDENVSNALELINATDDMTIGIVTNNFHVFRGMMLARRYTDADIMGIAVHTEYEFKYVVPDFRLNKSFDKLNQLTQLQKDKVEFLCNECCWFGCYDRKNCYENVSRKALSEDCEDHICVSPTAKRGYRFSDAMENPGFIGLEDIQEKYLPSGFSNFKIEGRSLGSAMILEFLLYYMTRPEYQLKVREEIYLDSSLDLF